MPHDCVTVFGGTGFLGRQIVRCLAAKCTVVRIAVRRPDRVSIPKTNDQFKIIMPLRADVRDEKSVAGVVKGCDAVINAVGLHVERGADKFDAIHKLGALNVAQQSAIADVKRLVHISGIGVDLHSQSRYARIRAEGECIVKQAYSTATILRPSVLFGPDDTFFNALSDIVRRLPVIPLFGTGSTQLQPVHVGDVAEAVWRVLADPMTMGKMYELGGPRTYSYKSLVDLVLRETDRRRLSVPVPFFLWHVLASLMKFLPRPSLTHDQIELMKHDNIVDTSALTLADLRIAPTPVETILPTYLRSGQNRDTG